MALARMPTKGAARVGVRTYPCLFVHTPQCRVGEKTTQQINVRAGHWQKRNYFNNGITVTIAAIPSSNLESPSIVLFGSGLLVSMRVLRRKTRKQA